MNKNLVLLILAVSLIPTIFSIGRGISGMVTNDVATSAAQTVAAQPEIAQTSGHFLSGAMLVYFIISLVLLSIVVSYLIALYHNNQKLPAVPKKKQIKHLEKMKSVFKGIRFAKIDEDKASQYIVAVVAIVGLVAILIMILR